MRFERRFTKAGQDPYATIDFRLATLLPSGESGLQIMKFINASVNSSKNNSIWTDLSSI